MNIIDAITRVDQSPDNSSYIGDDFYTEFNFSQYDIDFDDGQVEKRVTSFWLTRWNCTDTWVGARAYLFDGRPLAYSEQSARKNGENFEFVSKEIYEEVRQFLFTLTRQTQRVRFLEEGAYMTDRFTVDFESQLLDHEGFYQNRPCEVDRDLTRKAKSKLSKMDAYLYTRVTVVFEDGSTESIHVDDFNIPIKVTTWAPTTEPPSASA